MIYNSTRGPENARSPSPTMLDQATLRAPRFTKIFQHHTKARLEDTSQCYAVSSFEAGFMQGHGNHLVEYLQWPSMYHPDISYKSGTAQHPEKKLCKPVPFAWHGFVT